MSVSPIINVMQKAMRIAAKPLVRDFAELDKLQVSKKGVANFVSDADLRTERILKEELGYARKKFGFITEESDNVEPEDGEDQFWIIDPIDGTTNFIHAVPYFCISVAVAKRLPDGSLDVTAGMTYDPIHDELFAAEKGMGATLNGQRLLASKRIQDLFFATSIPRRLKEEFADYQQAIHDVIAAGHMVRCPGAAALDLAYVAAGRYDGTWYHHLKPWDIAAGMLLVREAGGQVSEVKGGDQMLSSGSVMATNGVVHQQLGNVLVGK